MLKTYLFLMEVPMNVDAPPLTARVRLDWRQLQQLQFAVEMAHNAPNNPDLPTIQEARFVWDIEAFGGVPHEAFGLNGDDNWWMEVPGLGIILPPGAEPVEAEYPRLCVDADDPIQLVFYHAGFLYESRTFEVLELMMEEPDDEDGPTPLQS
jgi:hypothetical protein